MFGLSISTIEKILFFGIGFAIGNILVPHNAFAVDFSLNTQFYETEDINIYFSNCVAGEEITTYILNTTQAVDGFGCDHENSPYTIAGGLPLGDYMTIQTESDCQLDNRCTTQYINTAIFFSVVPFGNGNGGPSFDFMGSTTLLASVGGAIGDGVRTTGGQIWPLLALLGVAVAFVIALQVVVFSNRSFGTQTASKSNSRAFGDVVDPKDRRAYKRGKKVLEKDYPSLYD